MYPAVSLTSTSGHRADPLSTGVTKHGGVANQVIARLTREAVQAAVAAAVAV